MKIENAADSKRGTFANVRSTIIQMILKLKRKIWLEQARQGDIPVADFYKLKQLLIMRE